MKLPRASVCLSLLLLLTTRPLCAESGSANDNERSCRDFAQRFYNWYVPKLLKGDVGPDLALKFKRSAFGTELYRRLKEDSEAQAKTKNYIVGLDFDPFLSGQDFEEKYAVGKTTIKGPRCFAEVYSFRSGEKKKQPDVVAELLLSNTRWIFVNFHYPRFSPQENLLDVLRRLRKDRETNPLPK